MNLKIQILVIILTKKKINLENIKPENYKN